MYSITKKIMNGLYPRRCPVCHDIVMPRGALLCPDCYRRLPFVKGELCAKCGKPLEYNERDICGECEEQTHVYTQGRAVFLYDEVMRKSIGRFKYQGRKEYALPLGILTARAMKAQMEIWQPQVILPIPLHREKLRRRGYNQAEELSSILSGQTGIPMDASLLFRVKNTEPMKELGAEERRENVRGAFACAPGRKIPSRILLLDDIYTTGSTMDAAAQALGRENAVEIYCVSVCIRTGFMVQ